MTNVLHNFNDKLGVHFLLRKILKRNIIFNQICH